MQVGNLLVFPASDLVPISAERSKLQRYVKDMVGVGMQGGASRSNLSVESVSPFNTWHRFPEGGVLGR